MVIVKLQCFCKSSPCLCLEEGGMQAWFILCDFERQFFAAILCEEQMCSIS